MLSLILAGIGFVVWALVIINTYYSTDYSSVDHLSPDYARPIFENGTTLTKMISSPFGSYVISMIIIYTLYKLFTFWMSKKNEVKFGVGSIMGFTLLHLFVVCTIYAGMPEGKQMVLALGNPSAMVLFFHVLSLLFYPVVLTFIARAFGYSILSHTIDTWSDRDIRVTVLADTVIGFFVFSILLLILGTLGVYTLIGLIVVLVLMSVIGWTGWIRTYQDLKKYTLVLNNHATGKGLYELINPRLLTLEFAFLSLTFMMSVAWISIIRPMPIGWDDLGVYMNQPKMLALTGEALQGAGMYTWQLITGSGFLFSYNAAQAFYVNQLGSILAVITITLGLSVIFESHGKRSFISLPLLLATVYYIMPMTVFHHTKDMKLDPALLFVSVTAFMTFFAFVKKSFPVDKKERVVFYRILMLVGILLGFAFSVKVTSLMLVLGILGLFAYRLLSFWGYMGFFFTFLAVFTGANLWSIMNVWMPKDSGLLHIIALVLLMLGVASFALAYTQKGRNHLLSYFTGSLVLILAFLVGLSPWIFKNTAEVKPWQGTGDAKSLLIQSLISGSGSGFQPDFTQIMSAKEYETKTTIMRSTAVSSDGQSQNEDLGRYFGYEKGINNYVRLPLNLTFQKNQAGEFTSITYIFLALVPVLFLFARGRYSWTFGTVVSLALITLFAYGFMGPTKGNDDIERYPVRTALESTYDTIRSNEAYRTAAADHHGTTGEEIGESIKIGTSYLSDIYQIIVRKPIFEGLYAVKAGEWITEKLSLKNNDTYPLLTGYLILLILNIIFIATIHFLTRDEDEDQSFREMSVILNTYGFLFLVSAFGIVWYGIFVYFIFFALIGILAKRFNTFDAHDEKNPNLFTLKATLAGLLFVFIALYFVRTALPHAWTNLRSAGFNEYKYSILDQEETLFTYRSDYFVPIATMNLRDTATLTGVINTVSSPKLKELLTGLAGDNAAFLAGVGQIIPQAEKSKDPVLKRDGHAMAKYIYNKVLYPTRAEANTDGIYRIGTFMTYLINKNAKRYYDDSLIFGFNTYFYEPSPEATIEKMAKLGFKFLLIDLNAATIDRDPRRVLTQRYENLLVTMRAKNLTLVDTDNLCLRLALDEYKAGKLQNIDEFVNIAGTNYESYRTASGGTQQQISRGKKQQQCYNYILNSIYKEDGAKRYPYLAEIQDAIDKNNAAGNSELLARILSNYVGQSYFALYEITDLPTIPTVTTPTATGSTQTGTTR